MKERLKALSRRFWPLLVLLPAAAFRLHAWSVSEPLVVDRSNTYLQPARELAGLSYSGGETFRRTPGYPVMLAGALTAGFGDMRAVTLTQHALGLGAVYALMRAALLLWGSVPAAAAAGLLAAFHPGFIFYEGAVESELFAVFLLSLAMLWAARAANAGGREGSRAAVAAGLLGAAAALTRPELAACLPAAPALLLLKGRGLRRALFCALAFAAPLALWAGRNAAMFGSFTLSPMGAVTSLQTSGPLVDLGAPSHPEFRRVYAEALAANGGDYSNVVNEAVRRLNSAPYDFPIERALAEAAAVGAETALRHPLAYAAATVRNFRGFFGSIGGDFSEPGPGGSRTPEPPAPLAAHYNNLLWLALAGLAAAAWRRRAEAAFLLTLAACVAAANSLVEVPVGRRSFEIVPVLIPAAAFLYAAAWELARRGAITLRAFYKRSRP